VLMNDNHCGVNNNHQRFENSLESKQQQQRRENIKVEDKSSKQATRQEDESASFDDGLVS
ncbi:hypothetical protein PIB30_081689, partial [Stylosanthes scabra]|nr:hypothetical protein [Stylosanthes scabra]